MRVMQVKSEKFHYLCELYPKTSEKLKELALIKREIVLHYMDHGLRLFQKMRSTGIPKSLQSDEVDGNGSETPTSSQVKRRTADIFSEN